MPGSSGHGGRRRNQDRGGLPGMHHAPPAYQVDGCAGRGEQAGGIPDGLADPGVEHDGQITRAEVAFRVDGANERRLR
jgi:hypothetical protein